MEDSVRIDRDFILELGLAVALGEGELAATDHRDRDSRGSLLGRIYHIEFCGAISRNPVGVRTNSFYCLC